MQSSLAIDNRIMGTDSGNAPQWGLVNVYETRAEMNSAGDVFLKKAKRLDIIAFGLQSFQKTQQKQVDGILSEGGDIRIITMRPGCDALSLREERLHQQISNTD